MNEPNIQSWLSKSSPCYTNLKISLDRWISILFWLLVAVIPVYGQDESTETEVKENVFIGTKLLNQQTTEVLPQGGWQFMIEHRFGVIGFDSTVYHQFLGMDLPANIRLGVAFPISSRWYWGVGRTKVDKTIDLESKYLLLRQTKDNSTPFSLAAYVSFMMRTDPFPEEPPNSFFADSLTAFEYKFSHKLSYNTQLIISRKFGNRLTLQFTPVLIYQNLVEIGRENYTVALPVSGRYRFGLLNTSFLFEYAPVLNNNVDGFINPLSIGVEFGTAGHVFQLTVSSSNYILEKNLYTQPSGDYTDGEFALGFNIKRTFWSKK
ncbi:MAG: hypothetical protein DHS20C17_34800 [Cyclobacteriaceae bacterium]|nr:MAG: hypothetical protein DHS20C17_34800 [Cyclobacteriaceae bacterium]